jgi:hypothetical protein
MKKFTLINLATFLVLLFSTSVGYSQIIDTDITTSTTDPACTYEGGCSANSVEIWSAYFGFGDGTKINNCNDINDSDSDLNNNSDNVWIFIDVRPNGSKHNFFAQFQLVIDNGTPTIYTIKRTGPIVSGLYKVANVTYACGNQFELKDILVSWDANAGGIPSCPDSNNYSQCKNDLPNITVDGPLVTDFNYPLNCNDVTVTTNVTGGKIYDGDVFNPISAPYTFVITYGDSSSPITVAPILYSDPDPLIAGDEEFLDYTFESHSYPINTTTNPIQYTITLTATDTTLSDVQTTHTVTIYPQLTGLTLELSTTSCNGSLGSITASGVSGGDGNYTYSISGDNLPEDYSGQTDNIFSNLPIGLDYLVNL